MQPESTELASSARYHKEYNMRLNELLVFAAICIAQGCQDVPIVETSERSDIVKGGTTSFEAVGGTARWLRYNTERPLAGDHTRTLITPLKIRVIPDAGYVFKEWEGLSSKNTTIVVLPGTVFVRAILAPAGNG